MGATEAATIPESAAAGSSSSDSAYVLPEWFMERNVKTALELARVPDQMVFCDECGRPECKAARADDDDDVREEAEQPGEKPAVVKGEDEPGQRPEVIHYDTFAKLRDLTCTTFMYGDGEELVLPADSAVVFRLEGSGGGDIIEPAWMSRCVVQLAKESAFVSLISFNFEDLEELGWDFHRQDKEEAKTRNAQDDVEVSPSVDENWQPDFGQHNTFLKQFFAARSERKAEAGSWQRGQRAVSAVLDAIRNKTATGSDTIKLGATCGHEKHPGAILVHIMDCNIAGETLRDRERRRVLTRFAEMVQARRKEGQAVTILLSTQDSSYVTGQKVVLKLGGPLAPIVTASSDKIEDIRSRGVRYEGMINTQRMRRLLRWEIPHIFPADLLQYSSDWASADRGAAYEAFGSGLWSPEMMLSAVALLKTRVWRSGKPRHRLVFADIRAALTRLCLFRPVRVETEAESQAGKEEHASAQPTNSEDEDKPLDLNGPEQELMGCVVNRGQSSLEGAIVRGKELISLLT